MRIEWLGHACFALESGGWRIVIDPYQGVRGFQDVDTTADQVFCSHGHFDHAYREGVALTPGGQSPFTVKTVASFHDGEGGALRGGNTIHIFSAGGLRAVHLGDLGHPLSQEQLAAIGPCDAVMIPVGGTYTIDARQAHAQLETLGARVVLPMHYRLGALGLENIGTLDDFLALCPPEAIRRYEGSTLELTAETPAQIGVLTYQMT